MINKTNWTEDDHYIYADMKRDELRDEKKERDKEFDAMLKEGDYYVSLGEPISCDDQDKEFEAMLKGVEDDCETKHRMLYGTWDNFANRLQDWSLMRQFLDDHIVRDEVTDDEYETKWRRDREW